MDMLVCFWNRVGFDLRKNQSVMTGFLFLESSASQEALFKSNRYSAYYTSRWIGLVGQNF